MPSEADLTFTNAVEGEGTRMKVLVSRSPSVVTPAVPIGSPNSCCRMAQISVVLKIFLLNRTGENVPFHLMRALCPSFSLKTSLAVRFRRLLQANARRLQADDSAKAG